MTLDAEHKVAAGAVILSRASDYLLLIEASAILSQANQRGGGRPNVVGHDRRLRQNRKASLRCC